jgi:hypothetical protein
MAMNDPPQPAAAAPPARGLRGVWILAGCAGVGLVVLGVVGALAALVAVNARTAAIRAVPAPAPPPPAPHEQAPSPPPAPTESSFETSPWISAARYAGGDGVFVTGAGGLFLCGAGGRLRRSPVGDLGEGLDLSADGSFVCASGRSGDVACFSKKPVPPSTFAATREGLEDGGSGR